MSPLGQGGGGIFDESPQAESGAGTGGGRAVDQCGSGRGAGPVGAPSETVAETLPRTGGRGLGAWQSGPRLAPAVGGGHPGDDCGLGANDLSRLQRLSSDGEAAGGTA